MSMASFGESLRRERELRDISLREIADATKINLRYLEALEQNRFDILPGGVFNKGFVRAFAQFIGIDAEAMVTAYLDEERSQSGAPAPAAALPESIPVSPPGMRWWVATLIAALVLLVVAAGLLLLAALTLIRQRADWRARLAEAEAGEAEA